MPLPTIDDLITRCKCTAFARNSLIHKWQERAFKIVTRLVEHGHAINAKHMAQTIALIDSIEKKTPNAWLRTNWSRSHHMKNCPCNPRNTPFNKLLM